MQKLTELHKERNGMYVLRTVRELVSSVLLRNHKSIQDETVRSNREDFNSRCG